MSITLNTRAYSQDSFRAADKVRYTGPDNTFAVKDILDLGRGDPKPNGSYRGNARVEVKRTKTVVVDTVSGATADAILTVSASLPVGMSETDVDDLRDMVGDFLVSTEGNDLFWKRDLTF